MSFNTKTLFYGDNLEILRHLVPNESIDLIYLDPPFNSKANYNILFKETTGEESTAQIQAFSDFWQWDIEARRAYDFLTGNEVDNTIANLAGAFFQLLGKSNMNAYLFMMAIRLIELNRVLKSTGSIFLHCDPTTSHYLKLMLDVIFGPTNFRNEIIWRRSHPKGHAFTRFAKNHDTILVYAKDATMAKWRISYKDYDPIQVARVYTHKDPDGRVYRLGPLLNPNPNRPNLTYEFKGLTRVWRWTKQRMLEEDAKGRIIVPRDGKGVPAHKRYLDEQEGVPLDDVWIDIDFAGDKERLGYPTQKPLALVERIINACTDQNDWILDPFCGCGTAVIAAERMQRNWIGIDITWLAINLVKGRLNDMFPGIKFKVEGEPRDMGAAKELASDRYQFQWWALSLIGARPVGSKPGKPREGKKGADEGIDGWLRFADGPEGHVEKIVVQVKSGHVGPDHIRELRGILLRERAAIGLYLTLEEPTNEMIKEMKVTDPYISSTWKHEYPKIQILTINELLRGKRPNIPPTISVYQEAPLVKRIPNHQQGTLFA